MLTQHEKQALQQSMQRELDARQSAVYKCAAGIALILILSIAGPVIGVHASPGPQNVASAGMLERLAGIAN